MQPLPAPADAGPLPRRGVTLLLIAAAGVPISLLWDFSWEVTVGIDLFWSPPHTLTYVAMALAGIGAALSVSKRTGVARAAGELGKLEAPLGSWLMLWSGLAFITSVMFDRWWQSAYGMGAGLWHPPQMLKAAAFFGALLGAWLFALEARNQSGNENAVGAIALCWVAAGVTLALINIVTISSSYPNQQHSASFYQLACATYPIALAALTVSVPWRWSATTGALFYTVIVGAMVWLLPLFPASPRVGPIYNQLDHLMPPPFPLLLVLPALLIDLLMQKIRWPEWRGASWLQTFALGFAFFFCFLMAQWFFARFLLTASADNWFFSGGGKHWPFFFKISPPARVMFWEAPPGQPPDDLNGSNALIALAFSIIAARLGLWLGAWMAKVRR